MIPKQSLMCCIALFVVSSAESNCKEGDVNSLMQAHLVQPNRTALETKLLQTEVRQEGGQDPAGNAESSEFKTYAAKVAIFGGFYGFVFGMMGAGGSLILKPLLYFAFDVGPFKVTIFNAFFVLIVLAGYGSALGHSKGKVVWQDVGRLGLCVSGVGCVCGALLSSMVSDQVQLISFAILITSAAAYMLSPKTTNQAKQGGAASLYAGAPLPEGVDPCPNTKQNTEVGSMSPGTMAVGITIGVCSGFAGVGGGFMLVPLLTHMGHDMTTAVPTSQAIICFSSTAGFVWYGYLNHLGIAQLHFFLCLSLTAVAMIGLYCSDVLGAMLAQATRQRIFALLLVGIGMFTIATTPEVWSYLVRLHLVSE